MQLNQSAAACLDKCRLSAFEPFLFCTIENRNVDILIEARPSEMSQHVGQRKRGIAYLQLAANRKRQTRLQLLSRLLQ